MSASDARRTETAGSEDDRFLDGELVPTLVAVGLVLALFPEPVTSALGLALAGVGTAMWLRDLTRGART